MVGYDEKYDEDREIWSFTGPTRDYLEQIRCRDKKNNQIEVKW